MISIVIIVLFVISFIGFMSYFHNRNMKKLDKDHKERMRQIDIHHEKEMKRIADEFAYRYKTIQATGIDPHTCNRSVSDAELYALLNK